jgi:hypothetical protein
VKFSAFIVAFFVFILLGQFIYFVKPYIPAMVMMYFDVAPGDANPNDVKSLEGAGNIFGLALLIYLTRKTYKSIAKTKN